MYRVFCSMGRSISHAYECRIVSYCWRLGRVREMGDRWRLEVKDRALVEWVTGGHTLHYTFYKEIEKRSLMVSNVKK